MQSPNKVVLNAVRLINPQEADHWVTEALEGNISVGEAYYRLSVILLDELTTCHLDFQFDVIKLAAQLEKKSKKG